MAKLSYNALKENLACANREAQEYLLRAKNAEEALERWRKSAGDLIANLEEELTRTCRLGNLFFLVLEKVYKEDPSANGKTQPLHRP